MRDCFLGPPQYLGEVMFIPIIDVNLHLVSGDTYLYENADLNVVGVIRLAGDEGVVLMKKGFQPDWQQILAYSNLAK